ncbi:hypothetical protein [Chitinophaga sp. S165]|uniref:hypothetical protein n=1 Tax=Chitinophaga sp. S165 TaxID=2135462 RepID=UPI000D713739|nr:hypothetical protein [Chitinophaga sp. S165]PWV54393.1 hypothetical protein C7475_1021151 [Chitinophaga sp. S165]
MNPIVEKVILIASIAGILSPIIPFLKYNAKLRKADEEWEALVDQIIKDFLANPERYRNSWKDEKL